MVVDQSSADCSIDISYEPELSPLFREECHSPLENVKMKVYVLFVNLYLIIIVLGYCCCNSEKWLLFLIGGEYKKIW